NNKECWHVIVTEENKEVLHKWRDPNKLGVSLIVGDIVGMSYGKREHNRVSRVGGLSHIKSAPGAIYPYDFGEEITMDQFYKKTGINKPEPEFKIGDLVKVSDNKI